VQAEFPHSGGDGLGPSFAADLLVMAESENQRPHRGKTLRQQLLSRLQVPHQAHLVIEGATAVDAPVRHHPRKGRVLPVLLRARLDRHHIHMRGKQHRGQGRITAGPVQ
jgi:hypothetical protein